MSAPVHAAPAARQSAKSAPAHAGTLPPLVSEVLRSPGEPLGAATREIMEPRFGHNFSKVRIQRDSDAIAATSSGECADRSEKKLQRKLAIGATNDPLELEADRVADQVMSASAQSSVNRTTPRIQRCLSHSNGRMDAAPPSVDRSLAGPGSPLTPALLQDMEHRFGHDFSRVRVHADAAAEQSARDVNAHAYTVGPDIVFGAGRFAPETHDGRRLMAHELTHVVQQQGGRTGLGTQSFQISPSGPCIARFPNQIPSQPPPKSPAGPTVLSEHSSDRMRRTRVKLFVTGHASPRWTAAHSNRQADKLNLELSHRREDAVRHRVEKILRDALPDQHLIFEYARSTVTDPGPFDDRATIDVSSDAVGSQQTLKEAGKAGRHANEPSMLRVDLSINLSSAIDTVTDTKVQERKYLSGATREWSIQTGVGMQVDAGPGGGVFNFKLKNRKTGQEVEGWGEYGTGGIGASVPIPTISLSGYSDFTTNEPVTFSDFDYKRVAVRNTGINALLAGYSWSTMYIYGMPGGTVDDIDVGGFAMGGAGIDLYSLKYGMIWLRGDPPNTYGVDVIRHESKFSTSRMTEENQHRVLFETGKAIIPEDQDADLSTYVTNAVANYQRGGVYDP